MRKSIIDPTAPRPFEGFTPNYQCKIKPYSKLYLLRRWLSRFFRQIFNHRLSRFIKRFFKRKKVSDCEEIILGLLLSLSISILIGTIIVLKIMSYNY